MLLLAQELKEKSIQHYEVEVPIEKVEEALLRSYRKVGQRLTVPGFRKGKATRAMLERRYGQEIFYEDAIDFLVPEVYEWILEDQKPQALDRPMWDVTQFAKGETAIFVIEVPVKPQVTLGDYRGVSAYKPSAIVGEEEIAQEIKRQQEEHARLVSLAEGVVQLEDTITLDYEGFIDGEAFEGGKGEDYSLVLGSGRFIPGFEDALIGKEIGVPLEITVTFPEDYRAEHLAGKDAIFKCSIKDTKRKQLLPVDDEFAQEVSEFDTLAEWEADLLQSLTARATEEADGAYRSALLDKVVSSSTVDVPDILVEREIDRLLQNFAYNLMRQGIDIDEYLRIIGKEVDQLRDDFRGTAYNSTKRTLVLDAVGATEAVEPSEEDMQGFFSELAASMGNDNVAEVEERMRASESQYESCVEEVRMRKVLDLIYEEGIPLDSPPEVIDLSDIDTASEGVDDVDLADDADETAEVAESEDDPEATDLPE
ncbi:MAG: trigger factor [Symbiobacteriaceae bacterium]|nr:trigger factor [Symbiobacteriaceae bacterium]